MSISLALLILFNVIWSDRLSIFCPLLFILTHLVVIVEIAKSFWIDKRIPLYTWQIVWISLSKVQLNLLTWVHSQKGCLMVWRGSIVVGVWPQILLLRRIPVKRNCLCKVLFKLSSLTILTALVLVNILPILLKLLTVFGHRYRWVGIRSDSTLTCSIDVSRSQRCHKRSGRFRTYTICKVWSTNLRTIDVSFVKGCHNTTRVLLPIREILRKLIHLGGLLGLHWITAFKIGSVTRSWRKLASHAWLTLLRLRLLLNPILLLLLLMESL